MRLAYLLFLLFLLGFFIFKLPKYQRNKKLSQILTWIGIIIFIVFIYSSKDILLNNALVANLMPGYGYQENSQTLIFKRANNGHFYIIVNIEGQNIKFLVDTGATDIALTISDAQKIGINTKKLHYTKPYSTANGVIYAAPINIKKMKIRNVELHNVKASVSSSDVFNQSLLGMTFLENLKFSIDGDMLTIYINE
jgi:aspartyl protease family protein